MPFSLSVSPRFFFFDDTATTEIYTLSLHDALPIFILVGIIELFSELFRMLTLTLRLWGNVLGGEIMLVVMSGLLLIPGVALPFVGLEVFIGLVQALVFSLLVLMYFVLAIESHDEEHEEGSHSDTDKVALTEQHPAPVAT